MFYPNSEHQLTHIKQPLVLVMCSVAIIMLPQAQVAWHRPQLGHWSHPTLCSILLATLQQLYKHRGTAYIIGTITLSQYYIKKLKSFTVLRNILHWSTKRGVELSQVFNQFPRRGNWFSILKCDKKNLASKDTTLPILCVFSFYVRLSLYLLV